MDYIRDFDIKLDKEMYYAGETLGGHVILDTTENFKLRAVRLILRGKAHAEWKVLISGDRQTVKDDQYFIDDRACIFGKEKHDGPIPVLPRGLHTFPFKFQLPESSLPCSFESKPGYIRYYIKVTLDIPYASPPQGMKYFTIIGPHIDCMDEQYLKPLVGHDKKTTCCLWCEKGPLVITSVLERTAYVCGESIKLRTEIDNQGQDNVRLTVKLIQYVEYFIERGVLGVGKEVSHVVLEFKGDLVKTDSKYKWDSSDTLVIPVMPPSVTKICRIMQIYYVLQIGLETEKSSEELSMHFPLTIATVPFRIPNSKRQPELYYDTACDYVEGGMHIGPEFLIGDVYDGSSNNQSEMVVLYRPTYVAVRKDKPGDKNSKNGKSSGDKNGKNSSRSPNNHEILEKKDDRSGKSRNSLESSEKKHVKSSHRNDSYPNSKQNGPGSTIKQESATNQDSSRDISPNNSHRKPNETPTCSKTKDQ
uniref:Arrestin domain-containing protein 3 n=1 Tax=Cacopsylla melanoneura TaxID=428564 RepID=A0A8D8QV53_9HEMI